jgi:hypothetical protein
MVISIFSLWDVLYLYLHNSHKTVAVRTVERMARMSVAERRAECAGQEHALVSTSSSHLQELQEPLCSRPPPSKGSSAKKTRQLF